MKIKDISLSPEQEEIFISTCCFFRVTSIENYPGIKNCKKVCLDSLGLENPYFNKIFNSKILDDEKAMDKEVYYDKLINWLRCPKHYLPDIRQINLIYRGSRDGFLS